MIVTQCSSSLTRSFDAAPSSQVADEGTSRFIVESLRSGTISSILGERNINVEHNKQPTDQEGKPNVARKRHSASAEADAGQVQQQKQQLELVDEEKVGQVEQPRALKEDQAGGLETKEHKLELVWTNVIAFAILHLSLPVAVYLIYVQQPWLTVAYSVLLGHLSMVGALAGAHRLWSHRSYKAKWPIQVLLLVFQTMAGQNSAYIWARDHRMHHKFSETDADPHNIGRGLVFAHIGWMCSKKHPEVREKGKQIDMSDLQANPYVMFQYRHFWWTALVFSVLIPTMIPVICWNERFWTSFVLSFMFRYIVTLHWTWLLNSAAHYHGIRPYDATIEARQSSLLIWSGIGEGAHNYHHTFPYDYKNSEFGSHYNFPALFIDLCAHLGLVTDRRRVEPETLLSRRERTGDLRENSKLVHSHEQE